VVRLAVWRERRAWAAAAAHLNSEGYPAAVPRELINYLSGLGLAVWAASERRAA
jgi:hypothetical protein